MQTVLQAHNITIGYSGRIPAGIARNISLKLKKGSLTALIGANGVGKSTLLRTLTALQKPLAGHIELNGRNIETFTAKEMAQNLSIVLTESLPPSNLTVFELVALGRQPYTNWLGTITAEDTQKINEAMQLTQVQHLAEKKHYEISDGQLQKVLIARALAQDTPLIILDEPTIHLDLLHKVSLLRLLKQLSEKTGKCILYSTHDLDLALQLSDEIIVMANGSAVQDTAENHIKAKKFDSIFEGSGIVFNPDKGTFTIMQDKL